MAELKNYNDYRVKLSGLVNKHMSPDLKNVLIFGDKFQELESKWESEHRNIVHLKDLKRDWNEVSRDNPNFELEVAKNSFDVLISYHGLEKAIDPERLLLELRKYLVKDGLFICITYNVGHVSTLINLLQEGWARKEDGALRDGNIRYFSYESLKELFRLTGFDQVGEDIYGLQEVPELTGHLVKMTRNPYLNALSFIFRGKRVEKFPFIEGTYP